MAIEQIAFPFLWTMNVNAFHEKAGRSQVDLLGFCQLVVSPSRVATLALLKLNAVVGVTARFDSQGRLSSMGVQCAFCHSTVDDSFMPGIGHRLDGWPNRDLNVGGIVALAPNPGPLADQLGVDVVATLKKVLVGGRLLPSKETPQNLPSQRGFLGRFSFPLDSCLRT